MLDFRLELILTRFAVKQDFETFEAGVVGGSVTKKNWNLTFIPLLPINNNVVHTYIIVRINLSLKFSAIKWGYS